MAGRSNARRGEKSTLVQDPAEIGKHRGTAADHEAVALGIDPRQSQVGLHSAILEQRRQPALVFEGLATDRRVIQQLAADLLAKEFVASFSLIQADTYDAALAIARECPGDNVIEIRELGGYA